MLSVLVGKEEKLFIIHKDLVCAKSRFFTAACSRKEYIESQEKIVRLPEADAVAFQAYVHWVYSGIVQHDFEENTSLQEQYQRHVRLYVLADMLQDLGLRNKEMDAFIDACAAAALLPGYELIKYTFDNTPESSLLRDMIVDRFIARYNRKSFAKEVDSFPRDFVNLIAKKSLAKVPLVSDAAFQEGRAGYIEQEK